MKQFIAGFVAGTVVFLALLWFASGLRPDTLPVGGTNPAGLNDAEMKTVVMASFCLAIPLMLGVFGAFAWLWNMGMGIGLPKGGGFERGSKERIETRGLYTDAKGNRYISVALSDSGAHSIRALNSPGWYDGIPGGTSLINMQENDHGLWHWLVGVQPGADPAIVERNIQWIWAQNHGLCNTFERMDVVDNYRGLTTADTGTSKAPAVLSSRMNSDVGRARRADNARLRKARREWEADGRPLPDDMREYGAAGIVMDTGDHGCALAAFGAIMACVIEFSVWFYLFG